MKTIGPVPGLPAEPKRAATGNLQIAAYALACLACVTFAIVLAWFPIQSDDLFMHLAIGRRMIREGRMPVGDPFLFTAPSPPANWWAHWGSHLIAYGMYRAGGYDLLILVKIAVVLVGMAASFWVAWRRGYRSCITPLLVLLMLWASCERFLERSSLASDVAGAWVLAILCIDRFRPSGRIWIVPFIFAVWTNVHPGVQPGLGFVVAALAGAVADGSNTTERLAALRRFGSLLAACVAATCLHPKGSAALLWAFSFLFEERYAALREHYIEFMPTFAARFAGRTPLLAFVALIVAVAALAMTKTVATRPLRLPVFHLICFGGLVLLGASSIRYVTTASLPLAVLGVDLAASLHVLDAAVQRDIRRCRLALAMTFVTATVALGCSAIIAKDGYRALSAPRRIGWGIDHDMHPLDVFALAHTLPRSVRIFNEHQYGVLLAWLWDGAPPIFFHGYVHDAPFFLNEYLGVTRSTQDFDRVVSEYDINAFLLIPIEAGGRTPLVQQLLVTRPEWHLCHWDDRCMLVVRDSPLTQDFIAAHEIRYFNPWRVSLVDVGLREDPNRVRREALRVLRCQPSNAMARHFVRTIMRADPDSILQDR